MLLETKVEIYSWYHDQFLTEIDWKNDPVRLSGSEAIGRERRTDRPNCQVGIQVGFAQKRRTHC
jgi:hypothetical protein